MVFSKTAGFRHGSIESGVTALKKLGKENGFKVIATEDSNLIVEDSLKTYSAVVFLNTTRDILNDVQQADFERYIQSGGGFVGIHAATDTEYDWPWYNKLVGAVFEGHPKIQEAKLLIKDKNHPSTKIFKDSVWTKSDEWYNFKNINPDINVVLSIDENSYEGGTNGDNHPISWYHAYDGGRSFYTELGHTDQTFENPIFLSHLLGGINYAVGNNSRDYTKTKTQRVPPEDRFAKKILDFNLNEPMELDELPGQGIIFVERRGAVKLFDFASESTKIMAQLDVWYGNEDGLLGVAVDPGYLKNHWVYFFYTQPSEESVQRVSRFTIRDNKVDISSEKILLEIPTDRQCCHSGGALEFGPNGNLFITVGDNTNPFESSGFAPIDEREGRRAWDAQKSAANTNDLRGKILRIKPEDNGTYSIPEGNLFPKGTPKTRPEIYVMGNRNPFRHSIDSKTGYLYWGDIGPDAGKADPDRGPSGMGEYDQAREAGFWGWPYTRGYNEPYNDYNFETKTSGPKFDPNNLINDSRHNTGLQKLPPAQKSMIPMTYYRSEEFPWMGAGGINPMAGPVFHASDYPEATDPFPNYFEDKLFLYEWMRDWIYVITLDENQNYVKADAFMPHTEFSHPMDMVFGSDGKLYVLEYGQKWNSQNLDARLSSITYLAGNREPIAQITQDKVVGAAPLTIQFQGENSLDYDKDTISYEWFFEGSEVQSTEMNPSFTFEKDGIYNVRLKVTDTEGNTSSAQSKIMVGNDAPELKITIKDNDSIYWYGKKISYQVSVSDKQDGSTEDNSIPSENVKVTFDYIPEGKDIVKAAIGHQRNIIPEGKKAIDGSDCKACHAPMEKVNGPSYLDIAKKYDQADTGYLVSKVIKGGGGVWGENAMSAHPQLNVEEVTQMIEYILSLQPKENENEKSLPLSGTLTFDKHTTSGGEGTYILMASYRDNGNPNQPESELTANDQVVFKSQKIQAEDANEISEGINTWRTNYSKVVGGMVHNSYLRFDNVNLKDLKQLKYATFYNSDYDFNGVLEIRENALDGAILGKQDLIYMGPEKTAYYQIPLKSEAEKATIFLVYKNPNHPKRNMGHADYISFDYKR
ncbi:ThuA domain-containing protein [Cytophaga sp. FL35]|uniref:ThuA domain-containing protein n=1 Tax=Cytophaga sp. FL35 TaxID=1904456 RepID=UPI0016534558|nr:ThuA domain-containing protein [Cytophaga sp. FL35]MBC6997282.1 ThuA domain-containing protein [Cytophaga sp. FL35]